MSHNFYPFHKHRGHDWAEGLWEDLKLTFQLNHNSPQLLVRHCRGLFSKQLRGCYLRPRTMIKRLEPRGGIKVPILINRDNQKCWDESMFQSDHRLRLFLLPILFLTMTHLQFMIVIVRQRWTSFDGTPPVDYHLHEARLREKCHCPLPNLSLISTVQSRSVALLEAGNGPIKVTPTRI